jgi:hypothetical protein
LHAPSRHIDGRPIWPQLHGWAALVTHTRGWKHYQTAPSPKQENIAGTRIDGVIQSCKQGATERMRAVIGINIYINSCHCTSCHWLVSVRPPTTNMFVWVEWPYIIQVCCA